MARPFFLWNSICSESLKKTAAPQILVCSVDKKARDQVLRAIERSDIMNLHPAIGLGQISSLGELKRLSEDDIEYILSYNSNTGNETVVLTAALDKPFGRRLFIPKRDGSSLRPATAGPILYINGKTYQLTVGHAFLEFGDFPLAQAGPGNSEHRDIENQNETGDGNAGVQLQLTGESSSASRRALTVVLLAIDFKNLYPQLLVVQQWVRRLGKLPLTRERSHTI